MDLSKDADATIVSEEDPLRYPIEAMNEKISGYAEVAFVVSKFGQPKEIVLIREEPLGYGFGDAALQKTAKLQFKPAVLNGKRVSQRVKRRYNFDLNETKK